MASTPDIFYQWGNYEALNAANLTKRFLDLSNRLKPLEAIDLSYQALIGEVNDTVLAETNATINSLRQQLQDISQLQWLTGTTTTTVALTTANIGQTISVLISTATKDLFTPTPYTVLQSNADPTHYAILHTQSYDRPSGQYTFTLTTKFGTDATLSDWSVGALSGATLAQMLLIAQATAAQGPVVASASAIHADRLAAESAASRAADAALLAQSIAGIPFTGTISPAILPTGTSVKDPGTGKLESTLPIQALTTGTTKAFGAGDLFTEARRSNGGVAMSDTFPASTLAGLSNGTRIVVRNADTTAALTITAGSGTQVDGAASVIIRAMRSVTFAYDTTVSPPTWRSTANGLSALLAGDNLSNIASPAVALANLGGASVAALTAAAGSGNADIRYLYLRVAAMAGIQLGMLNGIVDTFNNFVDVDPVASTNIVLDTAFGTAYPKPPNSTWINLQDPSALISSGGTPSFSGQGIYAGAWSSTATGAAVANAAYIGFQFGVATLPTRFIYFADNTSGGTAFNIPTANLQYSDDGTTWTTVSNVTLSTAAFALTVINIPAATGAHRYWRLLATAASVGNGVWKCSGFFPQMGYPSLFKMPYGSGYTGGSMGMIAPGGVPSGAFDESNQSCWSSTETGAAVNNVSWIGVDYGNGQATALSHIMITNYYATGICCPATVALQTCDDNPTNVALTSSNVWVTQATYSLDQAASETNILTVPSNAGAHRAWRLLATAGVATSNTWNMSEFSPFILNRVFATAQGTPLSGGDAAGNFAVAKAFDGLRRNDAAAGTFWSSSQVGVGINNLAYIGVDYGVGNSYPIGQIMLWPHTNNFTYLPSSMAAQWSDNGTTWTTCLTLSQIGTGSSGPFPMQIPASAGSHRYWRVLGLGSIAAGGSQSWCLSEIEFQVALTGVAPVSDITKTCLTSGDASNSLVQTLFDGSWIRPAGYNSSWQSLATTLTNVAYVGQDFGAGNSVALKAFQLQGRSNTYSSMPGSVALQWSDDMSTWTTQQTYNVDNTYTPYSPRLTFHVAGAAAHRAWRLLAKAEINGGPGAWLMNQVVFYGPVSALPAMTLQSIALPSGLSSPSTGRVFVQVDAGADAFTPNTDLVALISRDGTTFTAGTLAFVETQTDGTSLYDTGSIAISGQPAGTTMTYKITSANGKNVPITGVGMQVAA